MIVSHRRHAPPIDGVSLELDRVIAPGWVFRRAWVEGVTQDERLTTQTLGRGAPSGRSRILVTLEGRAVVFRGGRAHELASGDAVIVRDLACIDVRAEEGHSVEIDWEPDSAIAAAPCAEIEIARLGDATMAALERLSRALRGASAASQRTLLVPGREALDALRAEGLPMGSHGFETDVTSSEHELQQLVDAFDAELCQLDKGPALVAIEERLGWSRRTVARRAREAHGRYGISALSGEDWRSARDFYRLLLGTILASHPAATTERLSGMLGYSGPVALCHAFARAGLPSPAAVGARTRAAA